MVRCLRLCRTMLSFSFPRDRINIHLMRKTREGRNKYRMTKYAICLKKGTNV